MFEKEAEENSNQFIKTHSESDKFINCKRETDNYNVILAQGYELGFQKGAEFGYNKANEWHYVKDGDLPKESISVLVSLENKRLMECLYIPGEGFRDPVFSKWFSPVAWIEKEKIFLKEIE